MKRLLPILFVLLVAMPANAQLRLSAPNLSGVIGDQIDIPIQLEGTSATPVHAYQYTIEYDAAVVRVSEVSVENTLSEGVLIAINTNTPGIVRVAAASAFPIETQGTLLRIVGDLVAEGSSSVRFAGTALMNDGNPSVTAANGTITVSSSSVANEPESDLPTLFSVQTYPNPFAGRMNVRIEMDQSSTVTAELFDIMGRRVYQSAPTFVFGTREIPVAAPDLVRGTYLLRVSMSDGRSTRVVTRPVVSLGF